MTETGIHLAVALAVIASGVLTFIALFVITAPYGRHYGGEGWGPKIPSRWGWVVMEMPSVVVFAAIFFQGDHALELVPLVLLGLWQWHYVHRTFIFPFRMRIAGKTMPLFVVALAILFNCTNSTLNARWISHLGTYDVGWLTDPRFLIGALVFLVGFAINFHSDHILINLRKPGETGYKIPHGGAYRYVSSPNYLGELLEWTGFAIASWSLAGLAFALYTAANLVPRALSNHRWYKENFPDYPGDRRVLVPFVF